MGDEKGEGGGDGVSWPGWAGCSWTGWAIPSWNRIWVSSDQPWPNRSWATEPSCLAWSTRVARSAPVAPAACPHRSNADCHVRKLWAIRYWASTSVSCVRPGARRLVSLTSNVALMRLVVFTAEISSADVFACAEKFVAVAKAVFGSI